MGLERYASIRMVSSSGDIEQFDNDGDGDPIYIGAAPFAADDDAPVWYISKLTYELIGGEKCPTFIENCGTRQKWSDRTNPAIMGWRP